MSDLTVTATATVLGCSRDYIRKLVERGHLLRGERIDGRTYLINAASLAAWIDQRAARRPARKEAA